LQCRMRFAVEKTAEQRDEISLRATDECHSIRKMTATQTRRMGQIVQATFRIAGRQQLFAKLFRVSVQRLVAARRKRNQAQLRRFVAMRTGGGRFAKHDVRVRAAKTE